MRATDNLSTEFSTSPIWKNVQDYFGDIPLISGKRSGWRVRAKLAVRGSSKDPKIGLFKSGTHMIEECIDSPDHHPSINAALHHIKAAMQIIGIQPFNEKTLQGDLRYVQLVVQRSSNLIQLTLVSNGSNRATIELANYLQQHHEWHSLWINIQEGLTNTIFGPQWTHFYGEEFLEEKLLGKTVCFHPACFGQAHLDLFEEILTDMRSAVLPNTSALECFAGVGAISIPLSDSFSSGHLVELNPFAQECFHACRPPPNLSFSTMPAENSLELGDHEVVIVDPTRKGLPSGMHEKIRAKQLIYLSCNFVTLKRDLEIFKELGWKVTQAKGYLLFPNTPHVEILSILKHEPIV